jgi:signal transduction histidine kinase
MTDGDVAGILTIVRDIGEERRLRNGLTEINTKLNLLSSITRHDLLNQITAMLIYLEFIQDAIAEGNYAEAVDELDRMTKSLTNAEQIISFTREYQDLGVQAPRWQNLGRVVGSVTAMHDSGGISMVSYIDGIEVFADPMLNKIFINFLGNVAMHAGTATMVRIFFEEMADGCGRIVVEDDGQGVPADRKERIFEKGYGKNTGFGLFLTKEILAITRIGVAETGVEGEGARFEITVPAGSWRYAGHP